MMPPERLEAVRQSIANEEKFRYDHSAEVRADRRLLLRDRDELAALVREADEFAQGIEESFNGHYGDEGDSADCTEACGEGWDEAGTTCDSDKHRPDIEADRCTRQDECFRCMALDVREKFAAVLAKEPTR